MPPYDRVKDLIYTDEYIKVCDITTAAHTFNANNIWVKNCDFNAEEVRIPALWSKEPVWVEAFKNRDDIHKRTAYAIFGKENYTKDKRKLAKRGELWFALWNDSKKFSRKI